MYKLKRLLIYVLTLIMGLQLISSFIISGSGLHTDAVQISTKDEVVTTESVLESTVCTESVTTFSLPESTVKETEKYVGTTVCVSEPDYVDEPVNIEPAEPVEIFEEEIVENEAVEEVKAVDYQCDFNNAINYSDIPEYYAWETIGYLSCNSVGLYRIPITYGWAQDICDSNEIVMDSYYGEVFGAGTGVFICGHNYKALSQLKNVKVNDTILIETTYGANFLYQVDYSDKSWLVDTGTWYVGISDLSTGEMLQTRHEDGNRLGIFTCYDMNINNYRWYVRANLIKGTTIIKDK